MNRKRLLGWVLFGLLAACPALWGIFAAPTPWFLKVGLVVLGAWFWVGLISSHRQIRLEEQARQENFICEVKAEVARRLEGERKAATEPADLLRDFRSKVEAGRAAGRR